MTIEGSMSAAAAIVRMVARSYPSAANRSRAAARMAARVVSERRIRGTTVMPTTVGQHLLTCVTRRSSVANTCWPTRVGSLWRCAMNQDVVVVGAGPTGLLLAGDLAAAGVQVTVLERRPEYQSNLTRAFAVHARTLEVLDARGLADELLAGGTMVGELQFLRRLKIRLGSLPTP